MFSKLNYLLKQSSIYTLATMLQKFSGFLLMTLLTDTSIISIEENSAYNFFISTALLYTAIFTLGMESTIVRFVKLEPESKDKIISQVTWILFFSVLIAITLSFLFSNDLATYAIRDKSMVTMAMAVGLVTGFDIISFIPQFYYRTNERPMVFTLLKIVRFLFEVIFIFTAIKVFNMGIMGAVYGLVIASAVNALIMIPFYRKFLKWEWDNSRVKSFLIFGLPMVPNTILYLLIEVSDRYMINMVNPKMQVAYTAMYRFGALLTIINSAFRSAWQPIMLREIKEKENDTYFAKVLTYYTIIASTMMIFTSLLAIDFIRYNPISFIRHLIVDPFYYSQTHLLAFILLSYVFLGIYYNLSLAFFVKNKSLNFFYYSLVGWLCNLSINSLMFLWPNQASLIASVSTCFAFFIMVYLAYINSQKLLPIKYEYKNMIVMFLYMILVLILSAFFNVPFLVKLLIALFYLPFLVFSGVISKEEINKVKSRFRRA
jgi:O-antigen/teichoic acid export membrane protein